METDLRSELTPQQFKAVLSAPLAAGMYVGAASGGPLDLFADLKSTAKLLDHALKAEGDSGYGKLVDSLLETMRGMTKEELKATSEWPEVKDLAGMTAIMKQTVADAWAVVRDRPDADGFARWVLEFGRTAALTKTGGFLGIGGKSVIDAQEQAALDELSAVMERQGA
jgi:hypothetical protein